MKPSERIYQIWKELCKDGGIEVSSLASIPYHTLAIDTYLDEEYEKSHTLPKVLQDNQANGGVSI